MDDSKSILIADDNADFIDLLRFGLEGSGYQILSAADGSEALEIFEQNRPALVITDMNMPGLWGLSLIGAIQGIDPEFPIIVVSGDSDRENLEKLLALGVRAVFTKPFDTKVLLERIDWILEVDRTAAG